MPIPTYYVFDLDGTLLDTSRDLARSVNSALQDFHLPTHDLSQVVSFIGNGSINLIRKSIGKAGLESEGENLVLRVHKAFLAHYMEFYAVDTQPYPGVSTFLEQTHRVSLLTNKPLAPTLALLKHFGWEKRFEWVLCGDNAPARKPAPDGLLQILRDAQVQAQDAVFVGDDLPDIGCAQAAGVYSVALLSGFGKEDALREAKPDLVASDFNDFVRLIQRP